MMKFVFALVALVHLCHSYTPKRALNKEMMASLSDLNNLYRDKANITLPDPMCVPTTGMNSNAASCVTIFVRELDQVLDNVTVHQQKEYILQKLKANLKELDPQDPQETDYRCRMEESRENLLPFNPYINFLRKLNTSKKR